MKKDVRKVEGKIWGKGGSIVDIRIARKRIEERKVPEDQFLLQVWGVW